MAGLKSPTIGSEVAGFLGWLAVEEGRSPRTVEAYRRDLHGYEAWLGGRRRDVSSATSRDVEAWLASLESAGFAARTRARRFAAVRSLHRRLVLVGARVDDPTASLDTVRVPRSLPRSLSEDEIARLLAAMTGVDARARRDRALVELLYATGARISEVVGASLPDLDLDAGLLRVLGKGGKERVVPFGSHAKRALVEWLSEGGRPLLEPRAWRRRDDATALFLGVRGTRLTRQAAWGIVAAAAQRARITDHLSPHVLRHSCASHLLAHGADLRVVQELLGHASVSTTQVYTRVDDELLRSSWRRAHPRAGR